MQVNERALLDMRVTMVSGLVDEVVLHSLGYGWSDAPTVQEALSLKRLAKVCRRFLDEQLARLQASAEHDRAFVAKLTAPRDPTLAVLFARLLELRPQLVEAVGPRAEGLPAVNFSFDRSLPCFEARVFVTDPLYASRGSGHVVVDCADMHDGALTVRCTCRHARCVHGLLIVDALLTWMQGPRQDEAIVQALATKPWQRLMAAIDTGLESADAESARQLVGWRIFGGVGALTVAPIALKPLRRGGLSAGTKISLERVLGDDTLDVIENDKAAARALLSAQSLRTGSQAFYAALEQLIGHPRVQREPSRPMTVRRGVLGFVLEHVGSGYALRPTVDGVITPRSTLLSALDDAPASAPGFVILDEKLSICALVPLHPKTRPLLEACATREHTLPKEALPELLQRLPQLERIADVRLPEHLRGEEVIADPRLLIRLRAEGQGASVSALVDPLGDDHTYRPGEGAAAVTSVRDGRRIYAHRDLAAEKTYAESVLSRLPLPEPMAPFRWLLPNDEAVLDLLQALRDLGEPLEAQWTDESPRTLGLVDDATPRELRLAVKEGRDWFELEGEINLGGDRIALGTLLDAMRKGHRYVRIDARKWCRIEQALRERLDRLAAIAHDTRHGLEVGPQAAPVLQSLEESGVALAVDPAWQRVVERMQSADRTDFQPPKHFAAELRPYQREGFAWMCRLAAWGTGGVLADDMGLGKTIQALALLVDRAGVGPALVVAPTSVCFNWHREAARFAPTLRLKSDPKDARPGDVVITSYTLLAQHADTFAAQRYATFILDEAQAVKNADTARARAARKIQAECSFALSGTPIENHLGELWSILRIVSPGLLGSADQFRDRFLMPIERDGNAQRRRQLAQLLRPFVLRRSKAEVLPELPARTDIRISVTLSDEERRLYEDGRIQAVASLAETSHNEKIDARFVALAAITRLRLLACHPKLYDRSSTLESSKTQALLLLVKELQESGHRALVFSQFTSHLALVGEALRAAGYVYFLLQGDTPPKEREQLVDRFQRGEGDLFLISLKAGGFGLNLTGADYVIHLDPWWNPAVEEQATGRAHRIGQDRPVTVYRLVAERTIEDRILKLHDEKRDLVSGVLDDNDIAARLSTDALCALIREAV